MRNIQTHFKVFFGPVAELDSNLELFEGVFCLSQRAYVPFLGQTLFEPNAH